MGTQEKNSYFCYKLNRRKTLMCYFGVHQSGYNPVWHLIHVLYITVDIVRPQIKGKGNVIKRYGIQHLLVRFLLINWFKSSNHPVALLYRPRALGSWRAWRPELLLCLLPQYVYVSGLGKGTFKLLSRQEPPRTKSDLHFIKRMEQTGSAVRFVTYVTVWKWRS